MKVYITKEVLCELIGKLHDIYLREMLIDATSLHIEKFDSIWRIHEYPYLILADMGNDEGFVLAVRVHGIGGKEEVIEDLRKWCVENYIIRVSTSSIDFRYNTDYFTHFQLDERWVNVLFKLYSKIVELNTMAWKDELFKMSQEMNE